MDLKEKKFNRLQLATGFVPLLFSTAFMINKSNSLLIICVLSLFIIVGTMPLFRKAESLWMFILVAIAGVPVNAGMSYYIMSTEIITCESIVSSFAWGVMLFCVMFSIEEIIFGVITRLIWRKQKKIIID